MAYKILVQDGAGRWVFDSFSGDENQANVRYQELLRTRGSDSLKIVDDKDVDIVVGEPTLLAEVIGLEVHQNDGAHFIAGLAVRQYENRSCVIVDFDESQRVVLFAYLTSLGLTNITMTPWSGIQADNPTGDPVTGDYTLGQGFAKVYRQADGRIALTERKEVHIA